MTLPPRRTVVVCIFLVVVGAGAIVIQLHWRTHSSSVSYTPTADASVASYHMAAEHHKRGMELAAHAQGFTGKESRRLFLEAANSFRAASTIIPRELKPDEWAYCQRNLATALYPVALSQPIEQGRASLMEAISALRGAISVQENVPDHPALAEDRLLLATLLRHLSGVTHEATRRRELLLAAVPVLQDLRQSLPRDPKNEHWTEGSKLLARTLRQVSMLSEEPERSTFIAKAEAVEDELRTP